MTALLLSPGTGVCKPATARRRDTSRWWRQLTKLPRPIPQYLPFTLRYGSLRHILLLRRYQRRTAIQVSLVPLMLSF